MDEEEFTFVKIHIDDNGSDMLMKKLPMDKLGVCRQKIGLIDSPYRSEGGVCEDLLPPNGSSR